MEKIEKHAVIKYLFIKGMSTKEIYDNMFVTLGDDGPSYNVVKNWVAEFKLVEVALSMSIIQDAQNMQQVLKTFRLSMTR